MISTASGRQPHRVLYLHSSAGRYGADRQLSLLATTLDRDRYHPLVVLPFDGPLADELRGAGIEVLTGPVAVLRRELLTPLGLGRIARLMAYQRHSLVRLIRAQRIDLVHANTSVILGARRAAHSARARFVVHVREIYPQDRVAWPRHRRAIQSADAVLCVSQATATPLGPSPRVRVVNDGLATMPGRVGRADARLALGLPQKAFVAAVLGRISGWKGQEVLARALAEEPLREREAIGLVAGDVWPGQERWEAALVEVATRHGVNGRLRLVGFRDDVETVYGAADVVVVPSTRPDPLPNSALEAAAAGCCVVAADHGGLPEIIRDGVTGLLLPPGDHVALAGALAQLADDPDRRASLGDAAAADVRERFAPENLAPRVMEVYDEVLAAGPPRGGRVRIR